MSSTLVRTSLEPIATAILFCLVMQSAYACGFQIKEEEVAGLGRAYAGSTAAPDDDVFGKDW